MPTTTLLQLLAAFWASVACAAIAYYGCGLALTTTAKDKTKKKKKQKHQRAAAANAADAANTPRPAPPGSPRRIFFAALPVLLLLVASPSLFVDRHRAPILVTPVLGQLSLTAFKLLAFSVGRGPLANPPSPLAALDFIAWAVAPARALLSAAVPQALSAALAGVVASAGDDWGLPRPVKYWFYTLLLSQSVACVWQLWRWAVACLPCPPFARPLRTARQFDRPWLSESLADYWGRRWNVTTARALRALAYDPIAEGRLVAAAAREDVAAGEGRGVGGGGGSHGVAAPPAGGNGGGADSAAAAAPPPPPPRPTPLRRFLGLQATFLLSGAWHALVLYPPNTGTWRGAWRWFAFFSVWAPALVAERALARAWKKLRLPSPPRAARVVLTNALLIAVATPLFFGPCDTTGMCTRMFHSARGMVGLSAVGDGGGGGTDASD